MKEEVKGDTGKVWRSCHWSKDRLPEGGHKDKIRAKRGDDGVVGKEGAQSTV